ncbi:hypothetical protein Adeg_1350 [Ammonifex degensii KC4]|uniref:Uncharacterized protein n=1 Tax=Ammonifex degensii (strain DSM 10501 / KC4) TaxID=429009 RepID=C9R825_AMMDK|nr:hypothetical protein [Ammonifex degensii]ACX52454.1 hypothetical protein Adeg_1350 [Ammonifex degensii KC4]
MRKEKEKRLEEEKEKWKSLVGKFFHSFDEEGYVQSQGVVLSSLGNGYYVVQYFEWLTGSPCRVSVVHIGEMVARKWAFYESDDDMRYAFEYGFVKKRPLEAG